MLAIANVMNLVWRSTMSNHFYLHWRVCLQCFDAVGWAAGRASCKKLEWWGAGVVICLEWGVDLHMPSWCHCHSLSLFSKIQIVFTFLVPAHPGSPGKRAVKRVCVCLLPTSWSGTLYFILGTFLHPIIIFLQHMPVPWQLVLLYYRCYVIFS